MKLNFTQEDDITKLINSNDSIYHFTRKDIAIEYILNQKTLKLGSFSQTNDPQEYRPRMTSAVGWEWEDRHLDKIHEITRAIDKIIKSSGFLSFCENIYDGSNLLGQGCLKSRMWSQYAENHSGICLMFSKGKLLEEIEEQLKQSSVIYKKSVTYKEPHRSRIKNSLALWGGEIDEQDKEEIAHKYIQSNYEHVFFQKQLDYKDENEFRIVSIPETGKYDNEIFLDISSSLKTIILGDAFPQVYLPTIKALSKELNVPYRKLHWEKHSYILLKWDK